MWLRVADSLLWPVEGMLRVGARAGVQRIQLDRPVFVVGVERSGTTLLYSLLANHREFYWLSRLDSALPNKGCVTSLARRLAGRLSTRGHYVAVVGSVGRTTGLCGPVEGVSFWRVALGGSSAAENWGDYRAAEAASQELVERLRLEFKIRLLFSGKSRLLLKQPGFSLQLRFLDKIFPDALFVHVLRDPFENLRSLVGVKARSAEKFWGVKFPGWREYLGADLSVQAALQISSTLELIDRDVKEGDLAGRFLRVRYEDLVENPREVTEAVLAFCGMGWDARIERALPGVRRRARSEQGALGSDLPEEAVEILRTVAERYGYANHAG